MSSSTVTPDQGGALGQALSPDTQAPDVPLTPGPMPNVPQSTPQQPTLAKQPSRLMSTLAAIVSSGLQSIPDKGRATFVTGLGQGARQAAANEQQQQSVKFKSFEDQIRLSQLHNEELRMQWADEDHQNQVDQQAQAQVDRMKNQTGMTYTFVPNDDGGKAVLTHFGGQMAQDGAVSIPPGTIASPKGWYVPNKNSQEQAQANTKDYNARASFYGLPAATGGVVDAKLYGLLRNLSNGFDMSGEPVHANQLQSTVDNMSTQLDQYKKDPNADPKTVQAVQQDIDHLTALQKITGKREADALDKASERKINETNAINNNKADNTKDINASKPQKPVSDEWRTGATTMQKNKADLAENMVFNANNVASILRRRPDIVGAIGGRLTTIDQMKGTNDPDIVQLATDIENIAKANAGIHGQKAQEAVKQYEDTVLNHFKNGPKGIYGGLKSSVDSVQTFIDAARPDTYKTHSKNGGAIKSMVPNQ